MSRAEKSTRSQGEVRSLGQLAALLVRSLGQDVARRRVAETARQLGISGDLITLDEAMAILERLAAESGIVGVAARFAKARAVFLWDPSGSG